MKQLRRLLRVRDDDSYSAGIACGSVEAIAIEMVMAQQSKVTPQASPAAQFTRFEIKINGFAYLNNHRRAVAA